MSENKVMLQATGITVRYGQAVAVNGINLTVKAGDWVALIGANGAGKTSVLRSLIGLTLHTGRTILAGEDVSTLPAWERQRRGIGYVPEGRQIFTQMTVEENLKVGGFTASLAEVREGIERAYSIFPRLGERRGQMAATLSGGEQQMLALTRAMMTKPKLLLIDEISWGLMPILVAQVFERLKSMHREGLTILQVEQNAREVLRHADHAYVMAAGNIMLEGSAEIVASNRGVLESYIG